MPKRLICSECGRTGGKHRYVEYAKWPSGKILKEFRLHEECAEKVLDRAGGCPQCAGLDW